MAGYLISELGDLDSGCTYGEMWDCIACMFGDTTEKHRDLLRCVTKQTMWDIISRAEWDWLHATANFDTEVGVTEYTLESDVMFVRGDIFIPNVSRIRRVHLDDVRKILADPSLDGGIPKFYATTGRNKIMIAPSPAAAYTCDYDYSRYWTEGEQQMDDGDCPPLPTSDRFILFNGVVMWSRLIDNQFDAGTKVMTAMYEQSIFNTVWREKSAVKVTAEPDILPPSAW